jgi:mono/diheme cytochrome c family protein
MTTHRYLVVAVALTCGIWSWALDAGAEQTAVGQTQPTQAVAATVENGKALYLKHGCWYCHGLEGQGAPTSGPRIGPNPLPAAGFVRYIRAPRLQMPPYTDKVVSDRELGDIREFLASRPKGAPPATLLPD